MLTCLVVSFVFLAWKDFSPFSLLFFRPVHPSCGPLGFRFEVSCTRNHGAKARACQTPKIKTFIAPSRCCCVQMARSYQACLTSASVNTTRCLVDVLISAWSKKKKLPMWFASGEFQSLLRPEHPFQLLLEEVE